MKLKLVFIFSLAFFFGTPESYAQGKGEEHYQNAEYFRENNHFEEAIKSYDQALTADPKNVTFLFHKGLCLMEMSNLGEAIKIFERVIAIEKNNKEAYEILGNLYTQKRKPKNAITNYQRAFEVDENVENKLLYKLQIIDILYKFNKFSESGQHLTDAKKIAGENFDIMYLEARYFNAIGEYQKAANNMEKVVSELGTAGLEWFAKYYYELGFAYHKLGQYKKAQSFFEKSDFGQYQSMIREMSPEAYYSRALAYYKVYDYPNSNKYVDIALIIREAYPEATTLKSKLTTEDIDKSKIAKLIDLQENAIKGEKDMLKLGELYEQLCKLQFMAKDFSDAVVSADEALKLNPKNYTVNFLRAIASQKSGDAAGAAALLERMTKIPNLAKESEATFYFGLGLIHKEMGNTEPAYKAFKSAAVGPFKYAGMAEIKALLAATAVPEPGDGGEDDGEDDTTGGGE